MAINRVVALYIGLTATLAVLLLLPVMNALSPGISKMGGDLAITDVQFEQDYLNITVENICTRAKIVSEVTVNYEGSVIENQPATRRTIPVHEPISMGEQISIRVNFKWTSGYAYEIRLDTTDESPPALCVVTAP